MSKSQSPSKAEAARLVRFAELENSRNGLLMQLEAARKAKKSTKTIKAELEAIDTQLLMGANTPKRTAADDEAMREVNTSPVSKKAYREAKKRAKAMKIIKAADKPKTESKAAKTTAAPKKSGKVQGANGRPKWALTPLLAEIEEAEGEIDPSLIAARKNRKAGVVVTVHATSDGYACQCRQHNNWSSSVSTLKIACEVTMVSVIDWCDDCQKTSAK